MASCRDEAEKIDQVSSRRPCLGDPVSFPMLAPQSVSSMKGARFGPTRRYSDGSPKMHNGLDLRLSPGSKVYAMHDGYVVDVAYGNDWGDYVVCLSTIKRKQLYIIYAHLGSVLVSKGDLLRAGDEIARSGKSGNLKKAVEEGYTDPHLHLEIREFVPYTSLMSCTPLDPEEYMETKLSRSGRPDYERPCHFRE